MVCQPSRTYKSDFDAIDCVATAVSNVDRWSADPTNIVCES